jgi:methionyl aminopeptidase
MNKKNTKTPRNALCPCGSGKKYKKCCMNSKEDILIKNADISKNDIKKLYASKYNIYLKNEKDIEGIRKAGRIVVDTLDMVEYEIKPGITTNYINDIVHDFTIKNKAIPAPLNYKGFPKSVCVSVNEVVCHGIPSGRILEDGDIVNIDVTSVLDGYYADANKTFFVGNNYDENAKKIVKTAKECLKRAVLTIKPGATLGDIGWAIQGYAEKNKCSVVREFVGHGIGLNFHEPPQVPHYGKKGEGIRLVEGMIFTVEPMINIGKKEIRVLNDGWTVITLDRKLSAQFEQTFLVTKSGVESLTPYEL